MPRLKTDDASPYYPPRARWYRAFLAPWFALSRTLHLERIHLPDGVAPFHFLVSLLVPGFSFIALGRTLAGVGMAAVFVISGLLFLIALGHPIAALGYGIAVSIHAISIFYLELRWYRSTSFSTRVAMAVLTLMAVWLLGYAQLSRLMERHWAMPLRMGDRVFVVSTTAADDLRRGDVLAYSVEGRGGGGMIVNSGVDMAPVLALAGDTVEFGANDFRVNGRIYTRRMHMPGEGELVVPENSWFVWPNLDISAPGNLAPSALTTLLMNQAVVSREQFVGRPFRSWFGRRQEWSPRI